MNRNLRDEWQTSVNIQTFMLEIQHIYLYRNMVTFLVYELPKSEACFLAPKAQTCQSINPTHQPLRMANHVTMGEIYVQDLINVGILC